MKSRPNLRTRPPVSGKQSQPEPPVASENRRLVIQHRQDARFLPPITRSKKSAQRTRRTKLGGRTLSPSLEPIDWQQRLDSLLHHAQREAAALAATTPFPDLFLPCLLEEKVRQAHLYAARQQQVWQVSQEIRCLAA